MSSRKYDVLQLIRDRITFDSGLDEMYISTDEYCTFPSWLFVATYVGIVDQKYYQKGNIVELIMIGGVESFLEIADTLARFES